MGIWIAMAAVAAAASAPEYGLSGPTIVHFKAGEHTLTEQQLAIVDQVARPLRNSTGSIVISGHTDTRGTDEDNVLLSQKRANAVRERLVAKGVPPERITTQSFGESRPAIETADNVRESRNNRAEITQGPQSGW